LLVFEIFYLHKNKYNRLITKIKENISISL